MVRAQKSTETMGYHACSMLKLLLCCSFVTSLAVDPLGPLAGDGPSPIDGECASDGLRLAQVEADFAKYLAWMRRDGAKIRSSVRVGLAAHGGVPGIRGLYVSESVPKNTVLISLPKALVMTVEAIGGPLQTPEGCDKIKGFTQGTMWALEMKKGSASSFAPYFNSLPSLADLFSFHPMLADEDVQKEFSELPLIGIIRASNDVFVRAIRECLENMKTLPQSPVANVTLEEIVYANLVMAARVFHGTSKADKWLPMFDMANTAGTHLGTNLATKITKKRIELKTTQEVPAGGWLFYKYSSMDNEHHMEKYGIYLEDNERPLNTVAPCSCSHALRKASFAMLDVASAPAAVASGLQAPRCRLLKVAPDGQGQDALRCSLARLAWERCAKSWDQVVEVSRDNLDPLDLGDEDAIRSNYMAHLKLLGKEATMRGDRAAAIRIHEMAVKL